MIKSYNDWKADNHFTKVAFPVLVEWSLWNPLGGRGMGDQETEHMDRFGQMLGFNKSWWNVLWQDPRHAGDQFLTSLKKIISGEDDKGNKLPDEDAKATAASNLMVRNWDRIKGNSPFKQAFDKASAIKRNVNKVIKDTDLNHNEIHLLMTVLMNSHKGGNIPWKDINDLWRAVTGAQDNRGNLIQASYEAAKQNDVYTPLHLLKTFFGIGGGVFAAPGNFNEIYAKSEQLLRQIDPNEFNKLYQQKMGGGPVKTPNAGGTGGGAGAGGTNTGGGGAGGTANPPVTQAAPMDYGQLNIELGKILNQINTDPKSGASALQHLIGVLQQMAGGGAAAGGAGTGGGAGAGAGAGGGGAGGGKTTP